MAKISVAMAVYNGEQYLPEQLDSILQQFQDGDELVISYDNSTDGTWQLLEDYAARYPAVRLLKNTNPGVTGNFNNAISACTGDYIFISDQDDRWAEDKRQKVLYAFAESGADMVIHNGVHVDCQGAVISQPFFQMYRIGDGKLKNLLKPRYSGCCMAFTKAMAEKILPIPANTDAYDHWLGTVGEFFGTIAYCEDILLYHRLHGGNVTPVSTRKLSVILGARGRLVKELLCRMRRERSR